MLQLKKRIRGIIFDLDGTLLNTLPDLHAAVNYALARLSLPLRKLCEIRGMIGNGASMLIMRALPDNAKNMHAEAMALFSCYYSSHICEKTKTYDEIANLITAMQGRCKIGVLSNKPHNAAVEIVRAYFGNNFAPVFGKREDVPLKPDPAGALEIADMWGLPPDEIAMIGDSMPDILTAKAAGMLPIAVTWGYGDINAITLECPLICDNARQLKDMLLQLTAI
ncbi:MAG: HAD-IA family hydrolase [Clostridia bacterium]|nr:HAD-IA family hydrolase [Clostridia bacterium]